MVWPRVASDIDLGLQGGEGASEGTAVPGEAERSNVLFSWGHGSGFYNQTPNLRLPRGPPGVLGSRVCGHGRKKVRANHVSYRDSSRDWPEGDSGGSEGRCESWGS